MCVPPLQEIQKQMAGTWAESHKIFLLKVRNLIIFSWMPPATNGLKSSVVTVPDLIADHDDEKEVTDLKALPPSALSGLDHPAVALRSLLPLRISSETT